MKQKIKYLAAGILIGATVATTAGVFASNYDDWIDVAYRNIKIVVNGKEIHPSSEPFVSDGTTYLPVRDVAEALDQPVDWDGPNYTVYIGNMNGKLNYASEELSIDDDIGDGSWIVSSVLKDNLGNTYSRAIYPWLSASFGADRRYEKICNMKYSNFKGTLYVMSGSNTNGSTQIVIKADGKTVYTSPEITKSTAPIDFDVNITGCYDLQIICTGDPDFVCIGDGGFYQ